MTVALQNIETDLLLASWTQIGENCKVEWAEVKIKRWSWCSPWGVLLHKWANQCRPNLHYSVSGKIPSLLWKWPQLCRFYQILRNPCREWMRCSMRVKNNACFPGKMCPACIPWVIRSPLCPLQPIIHPLVVALLLLYMTLFSIGCLEKPSLGAYCQFFF